MSQAQRYTKLAALTQRADTIDCAYHAAFYLLSFDPEIYETAKRFVSSDGIYFSGLKRAARGFDERSRHVIDVAHNLFSYSSACKATPFEISRLGYPLLEQVCNALYIAAGEVTVEIRENENGQPEMLLDATPYERTKHIHSHMAQMLETAFAGQGQPESEPMER